MNVFILGEATIDRNTFLDKGKAKLDTAYGVPVYRERYSVDRPGSAANVAHQLAVMSMMDASEERYKTHLFSAYSYGLERLIHSQCTQNAIEVLSPMQIVKERYFTEGICVLRMDRGPEEVDSYNSFCIDLDRLVEEGDIIVLSDYDRGFIDEHLFGMALHLQDSRNVKVIVDAKKIKPNMKGAFILKCNEDTALDYAVDHVELGFATPMDQIIHNLDVDNVIVTSERGSWRKAKGEGVIKETAHAVRDLDLVDTCGAGDMFIVGLVRALIMGADITSAVGEGHYLADISTTHFGTYELEQEQ